MVFFSIHIPTPTVDILIKRSTVSCGSDQPRTIFDSPHFALCILVVMWTMFFCRGHRISQVHLYENRRVVVVALISSYNSE